MKILIFAGVSPNTFVYMMDEAELYYRLGHEVYFVLLLLSAMAMKPFPRLPTK